MSREADLAWAAGIIEGEGNFNSYRQKKGGRYMNHWYYQVSVGMSEKYRDILARLKKILGGTIYGPYTKRRMLFWRRSDPESVCAVALDVYPYLGKYRRAQVRKIFPRFRYFKHAGK